MNSSKFKSLIAALSSSRIASPTWASAATLLRRQMGRIAILGSVLAVSTAPALAEGSRSWYPTGATGNRGSLYNTGGTLLGGTLKTQTIFRIYAQAGEYIMTGSTVVGQAGSSNIRIFNPSTVTGAIGTETLPSAPDFSCNAQRTSTGKALGFIGGRAQELAGPDTITNAATGTRGNAITNSYLPCYYQAPSTGVYFVVFDPFNTTGSPTALGDIAMANAAYFTGAGQGNHISAWDVTVRSSLTSTVNLDGRLFMYYTYIRHGNNPLFANFSLYPVTIDGYRYQTDLRGIDPNAFVIYGNSSGFYDQDGVTPLYHDILGSDDALSTITGGAKVQRPEFPIFFTPPSSNPTLNTILFDLGIPTIATAPTLSNLTYQGDVGGKVSGVGVGGTFTYSANVNHTYNLVISRDGVNFDPSNPLNRFLKGLKSSGTNTITWNGKDNQGNNFPAGTNYKVQMFIVNGEYHFPLIDAENSPNGGPTLKLLNSPGACLNVGCDLGYYDDRAYYLQNGTAIGTFSGTTPQVLAGNGPPTTTFSGSGGFATSGTQRKFGDASTTGFGDKKGLDIWTYFPSSLQTATLDIVVPPSTGSPFNCDARFYQVRAVGAAGSEYSQLFQFNRSVSPYTQAQISSLPNFVLNGLAFNVQDGYLYATYLGPESSNPTGVNGTFGLYKIGQTGLVSLGAITGLPTGFQPTAADMDQNGKYYLTRAGGSSELYVIDTATKTATLVTLSASTPNLGDMSYNPKDGFLYGVSGNSGVGETLYKINPISGAVTSVPLTGLTTSGNWGTSYFDVAGTFYAYGNEGAFYQIDLTTGAATLLSTGPTTNRSDGASCVFPAQKLDVVKAAGIPQAVNNKTFNVPYTVIVKNTGTVSVPNIQLTEDLKRTFATGNPTITIQTAPATSGSALTLNSSFNGTTDTRLLMGTDSFPVAGLSVITFTVQLVYPDAASVPTGIQNNTVYATSSSVANNPGYSFVGATNNVPLPPSDLLAGDLSTNGGTLPASANADTPTPTPITLPTPTVTDPNVLLVKRITAINGNRINNPNDSTPLNGVVDDPTINDTNANWPLPTTGTPAISAFLTGAIDGGKVKPGDTIEYTIYFLNAGGSSANNVRVCDRIIDSQKLLSGSTIQLQKNSATPTILTSSADTDRATFYTSSSDPAITKCNFTSTPTIDNGAIVVDVTGATGSPTWTTLPGSTGAGTTDTYGFVRFTTKVNP